MKIRPGPLVAIFLLLGLGIYVYVVEFRGEAGRRRAEESRARPLPFDRSDLQALVLENDRGRVRLEPDGEEFRIVEPLDAGADRDAVEGLLSSLELARVERRIEAPEDLAPYGLDPPRATVTAILAPSGEERALAIGGTHPIGGSVYVLLPESGDVGVVSSAIGDAADRDLFALRDKSLLTIDPWKATSVRIERGTGSVLLEKPATGWRMLEPIPAPADGPTVTDLLGAVDRLRATEFVAESPSAQDLRRFGLDPPAARVSVMQNGWEEERTISFGAAVGDDRYVRRGAGGAVVKVPDGIWEKIRTPPFDLRRKEILGVSQYRIESITASIDGGAAVVIARGEGRIWNVSGRVEGEVQDEIVDALLRVLGTTRAVAFADDPDEKLRSAIASRPVLDLTIRSRDGGDDAGTASQHLLFGRPDVSGRLPVRDMAWRPLALVEAAALQRIRHLLGEVTEAALKSAKEEDPDSGAAGTDGAGDAETGGTAADPR